MGGEPGGKQWVGSLGGGGGGGEAFNGEPGGKQWVGSLGGGGGEAFNGEVVGGEPWKKHWVGSLGKALGVHTEVTHCSCFTCLNIIAPIKQ